MALREKLKRAFKSNSPASSKHSSPIITQTPEPDYSRWPSNVYRPDEPMPRPKYRAPVKKEHKEKLESFNFGGSWRRKSHVSLYSPMGSRMPSRRGSRVSRQSLSGPSGTGRDSLDARRKSLVSGNPSRSNSITAGNSDKVDKRRLRHSVRMAQAKNLQPEPEHSGDDDVTNVGISRHNSRKKAASNPDPPPPAINVAPATPSADPLPVSASTVESSYFPDHRDGARLGSDDSRYSTSDSEPLDGYEAYHHHKKADSGPPSGQCFVGGHVEGGGFTEDELAGAMARSRMSSQALPAAV